MLTWVDHGSLHCLWCLRSERFKEGKNKSPKVIPVYVAVPAPAYRLLVLLSCHSGDHISRDEGSVVISFIVFQQCVCFFMCVKQRDREALCLCVCLEGVGGKQKVKVCRGLSQKSIFVIES